MVAGLMRIVGTSNFAEETFSEFFVKECDEWNDERMQKYCDNRNSDKSTVYFKLMPRDYKLYKWEP